MRPDGLAFVKQMMRTFQSGIDFMNDIEHKVDDVIGITIPIQVMYSSNDKSELPTSVKSLVAKVSISRIVNVSY